MTVELIANAAGTLVRLTHEGFSDEQSRGGHEEAWAMGLDALNKAVSTTP